MRLLISQSDLAHLKRSLRASHAAVPATKRIEGAARGFGFKSYATFRLALAGGHIEVEPNDTVYERYITSICPGEEVPRALSRALARIHVDRVLDLEPGLTCRGYDGPWPQSSHEREMSLADRRAAFAGRRTDALSDYAMDEFELALIYLETQGRRKTINRDYSSYGLKHQAENLSREHGLYTHLGNYVSNGMLIVAAIVGGFQVKKTSFDSPNAYLSVSSKTVEALRTRPIIKLPQKRALFEWAMTSVFAQH